MAHQQNKLCPVCKQIFRARKDAVTCSARCRKRLHRAKLALEREAKVVEHSMESAVEAGEKVLENLGSAIAEELTPSIATEEGYVATPTLATLAATPLTPTQPTIPANPVAAPITPTAPSAPVASAPAPTPTPLAETPAPPLNSYLQDPSPVSASTVPVAPVTSTASSLPVETTPVAPIPVPGSASEPALTPAIPAEPKVEDLPAPTLETVDHNAGDVFNPGGAVTAAPTALQPEESLASTSANPVSSVLSSTAAPLAEAPVSAIQQNLANQPKPKRDYLGSLKQALSGRVALYARAGAFVAIISVGYFGFSALFHGAKPPTPVSSSVANSANVNTVLPTNSNATSIQFNRATSVAHGNSLTATGQVTFKNSTNSVNAFNLQDASGSDLINADTVNGTVTIKGLKVNGNLATTGSVQLGSGTSLNASSLVINSTTVCTSQGCAFNLPLQLTQAGNIFNTPNSLIQLNGQGLVPDSLLGPRVAFLDGNQTFTGNNTFTGKVVFQNAVNGSSNFEIQNASGTGDLFMVDTVAGKVGIGRAPLPTTAAILQVNGSVDLTGQITFNGNQINTLNLSDSSNIARLNANQTFTGNNTFSGDLLALNLQPAGSTLTVGSTSATLALQGNLGSQLIASSGTFNTTIGFSGTPTGNVNYNFDTSASPGSYTICTTVGNCVGAGGAVDTPGGNSGYLAKFTGTETIADSSILDNGLTVTVGLPSVFKASSNSATAFRVQSSNGLIDLLVADTLDSRVGISLNAGNVPQYPLDVTGDINSSSGLRVGGNLVCTSTGCGAGSGSGFYIQNGTAVQPANFNIQSTAIGSVVAVVQGASGQTADLFDIYNGSANKVITVNNTGSVLVQPSQNSATAFQIQNAAGNSNLFVADTADSRVGINNASPAYALDVNGDVNISNGSFYRINGVSICGPQATCAPTAGSSFYIQNSTTLQTGANFFISSANINNAAGILRGAIGQLADILDLQDGNGNNIFTESAGGSVLAKTTTNSTTGFQVQNSSGQAVFLADTVNNQVGINTSTPTATLSVNGTGLIQASNAINPVITVTGNEITDANRTSDTQGDGRAAPDSSYGIWEGTTNLIPNGGVETNSTGWSSYQSNPSSFGRITSASKFGGASTQVYGSGSNNYYGMYIGNGSGNRAVVSASTAYTASAWLKLASGSPAHGVAIGIAWYDSSGTSISSTISDTNRVTLGSGWIRLTNTATSPSNAAYATIVLRGVESNSTYGFDTDGAQLEQKAYATPYVETNGATASRNNSGVEAPASLISTSQSWVAVRARMGYASSVTTNNNFVFSWDDGSSNNRIQLFWNSASSRWETRRVVGAVAGSPAFVPDSFNVGDLRTFILSWTSSNISISVNGASFTTASNGNIPAGLQTSFNIGDGFNTNGTNGVDYLNSDVLWAAAGTGTLTNVDATNINNFGNIDPAFSNFPGYSTPTMVWQANTANYINNSSSSNLVFNVENSLGQSLLNVDTNSSSVNLQGATSAGAALTFGNDTLANLYRSTTGTIATSGSVSIGTNISVGGTSTLTGNLTANGSALFQNSSDSTTAFQIQNSTGTNLFTADTLNSRIGIGTSSPVATLQVNGTGLFQAPILGSSNTLTASGNEITDASRTTATQGDGLTPPDSSYGIWETSTNLETNGGFESSTTGWNYQYPANGSDSSSTDRAKFGTHSLKITRTAATSEANVYQNVTLTASTTYYFSAWVWASNVGDACMLTYNGTSNLNSVCNTVTGQWQRLGGTFTTDASGNSQLRLAQSSSNLSTVYFDGVQVEQKSYPTPYIDTNGTTASRSAPSITAPSANFSPTNGWMALRVRVNISSTQLASKPTGESSLFYMSDGTNSIRGYLNSSGVTITRASTAGSNAGISLGSWSAGTTFTLIFSWTSSTVGISHDGSAFSSTSNTAASFGTMNPMQFGTFSAGGGRELDGDILWAASGTGTLTNTDASNINNFGNTDPNVTSFASSASTLFVWQANNTSYSYPGYQPITFQVQNSTGSQLLGIDANASAVLLPNATSSTAALILGGDSNVNLYRSSASTLTTNATFQSSALQAASLDTQTSTALNIGTNNAAVINLNQNTTVAAGKSLTANGTVLAQNSLDSTNAFAIQNAAGTSNLFIADTADSRLGVGTAAPLATFNVSGSSLFQGASSSANSLTLSGNEITDSTRTVSQQGDGRASPDSSYGIWESTTNLVPNGGFETSATGTVNNQGMITINRTTSQAKFGSASVNAVGTSSGTQSVEWRADAMGTRIAATAGNTYTFSLWQESASNYGHPTSLQLVWYDGSGNQISTVNTTVASATTSWGRVSATQTAPANTASARIAWIVNSGSIGDSYFFDGIQFEQNYIATPYVDTNGTTATRNAGRVQASASLINATQGWFAARVRPSYSSSTQLKVAPGGYPQPYVLGWRDGTLNNRIELLWYSGSTAWRIISVSGGTGSNANVSSNFNAGDSVTLIASWTSTQLSLSVNGSPFTTVTRTGGVPTGLLSTFDIGDDAEGSNGYQFDGDILWTATGMGTLTNADATNINALGSTDPYTTNFSQAAYPTMVWHANNGTYQTGSSVALQVQNSNGANLLAVDSANSAIKVGASTKLQNLTDSTNALTVTNAAGSQLFNVNTSNLQVSVANLQSSGSVNIVNPQGSISLSPGISSPNGLTVSGNEITDATRTAALSWTISQKGGSTDNFTSDSSYGIWEAGTNLFQYGQADSVTNWSQEGGSNTSVDTTVAGPFSPQSIKVVSPGSHGVRATATGRSDAAGTAYVGSVYVKAPSGTSVSASLGITYSDSTTASGAITSFTATGSWQLITPAAVTVASGKTGSSFNIYVRPTTAVTFWVANAMLQAGVNVASPYIATSGGANASRSAARVQAPASALNATQGWVAMRIRMGGSPSSFSADGSNPPRLWSWGNNYQDFQLYPSTSYNGSFTLTRNSGRTGAAQATSAANTWASAGDVVTVIASWDASGVYLSVNGSAFSSGPGTGIPSSLPALFDIGSLQSTNPIDGDILWTATGTGTLTSADASTLNSLGNSDPTYASLTGLNKGSAGPTLVWNANTAAYQDSTSSNGDSLIYAANTSSALTGNLLDLQSGSVPSSKFNVDTSGNTTLAGTLKVGGLSTFTGSVLKPVNDSTGAFQIQNAGGSSLFNVDSTNNQISLGSSTTLVLGNKATSGDPANPVNGEIYYNSSLNAFRCYQAGVWVNCTGSGGGGGGGGDVNQGGNTFGANMVIGTNDNYSLSLRTNATNVMTLGTDGSALFQNSADSPTAFQIQNQAGSSNLFVADTTNTRIGIGTSSPTSTLSVNGSTTIQQSTVTSPTLTVSGNEITDVTRTTNTQGDGRTPPDSSYGVWVGSTNLLLNGGSETNSSNIGSSNSATITRTTSTSKFGSAGMQVVTPGSVSGEGISYNTASGLAAAAGNAYTGSVWVKGSGTVSVWTRIVNTDSSLTESSSTTVTLTSSWQRVVAPSVSVASGKTGDSIILFARTSTAQAVTFYTDGAQEEQRYIATPYIETNGTTASRTSGSVQAPASSFSVNQGWFAIRVRMGWSSTATPNNGAGWDFPLYYGNSGPTRDTIDIVYTESLSRFGIENYVGNNSLGGAQSSALSFSAGTYYTIIGYWTTSTVGISINGSAFTTGARGGVQTASLPSTYNIGGTSTSPFSSDVMWSAAGSGTLTNTDAANMYALGNTDPSFGSFAGTANPTMTWAANNSSYSNSAASSGLVLNLQNSTGTNLLGVDATANQITASTSAVFKNSVNGTGAFQIQNAAGNNLLSVDTINNLVNLGTPGTSGTNGSLVLNSATSGNYSVTLGVNSNLAASYSLSLPTAAPTTGQCLQVDSLNATQLDFVTCSGGGGGSIDLQGAYNNSASPATIATTASSKGIIFKAGTGNDSTTLFQVQNSGGTAILDVDTTNGRVGIGTNNPGARLDVASGTQTVIRGNSTGSNDILDLASNGTNTLTVSSTGAVLAQNTTDSTGAFKIQNAAGTSNLFVADTTDSRLGIGTATSVATVNVVGSTLIQQGATTSLTVSGNEITDATRTANTQGDGRTAPDSSEGIWEGTTNLVTNGGFESNTTGWSAQNSASFSQDTTTSKFGAASLKVTTPGSITNEGVQSNTTAVSAGQVWTASGWVKGSGNLQIRINDGVSSGQTNFTATSNWQKVSVTYTIASGATTAKMQFLTNGANVANFDVDGAQLEQKAYATPYVDTNGSTATRNAARVQAPVSALSATQGWFAVRVRAGVASSSVASIPGGGMSFATLVQNVNTNKIDLNYSLTGFHLDYVQASNQNRAAITSVSFSAGDLLTVIGYWTSSTVGISVNGSAFTTASRTNPDISPTTLDFGSQAGAQNQADSDILWTATGSGTLTNTDATNINAFGSTDPNISSFTGTANPTMIWKANTSAYNTSSNADLALQVMNSAGSSLLSLDAANTKLTVNTAGLFQNTANSANALTVNTASGTQLFNVNTSNLQVTASNLQSSGAVNLVNSNGTVSLAGSLQSTNTLTTSGNEITDASRTTNTSGDGRTPPDSSYGIWESTTNLINNGGFESNKNGWAAQAGTTSLAQTTTISKFGSGSLQINPSSDDIERGAAFTASGSYVALSPSTTYTVSAWAKGVAGTQLRWNVNEYNSSSVNTATDRSSTTLGNFVLDGTWQRFSYTWTTQSTTVKANFYFLTGLATSNTFYLDGVQVEQKAYATPYVETNGAAATRNGARVQAPASDMNATQGWFAMSGRFGFSSAQANGQRAFWFGDGTQGNVNRMAGTFQPNSIQINENANGGSTETGSLNSVASWNVGDKFTAIFAWTANSIYLSYNGGAFTTISRTQIPVGLNTFDIGSIIGNNSWFDGDVFWVATGTGTLSNADATNLNAYGNTDPVLAQLYGLNSQAANPTFVWNANSANYQDTTSSNGDALIYAANTTGTTGNLIDVQSGAFPSSRFSVSTTGQTLVQTSTNSTTAFQVQNSSGSAVILADTVNNQVGINTSTPTATLAVNGTGLIQANSATNPLLTTSGNEITDATRTASTQGDGRTAPDSSYGIWEGTTNLNPNGGFESNLNSWSKADTNSSVTWTQDTSQHKFGSASSKLVNTEAGANDWIVTNPISVSPSTTYTASAWVNVTNFTTGAFGNQGMVVVDQVPSVVGTTSITGTTSGWVRLTTTFTTSATASSVNIRIYAPQGTEYVDGVQLEQKATATPYVETNGATATRNTGRIQTPSNLLNATQGWVAMRIRINWDYNNAPSGFPGFFDWRTDNNNRLSLSYTAVADKFAAESYNGGTDTNISTGAQSFTSGSPLTIIMSWTSTTVQISVNGSTFAVNSSRTVQSLSGTSFDIGTLSGSLNADSDYLWFASGTGTLTNTDAVTINGFSNTDPGFSSFSGASLPTMVWQANTASYINNSNTSNLVFNVENSLGQSLFNVDTNSSSVNLQNATSAGSALTFGNDTLANLYRSTSGTIATSGSLSIANNISISGTSTVAGNFTNNGSALFQNSTNSTTAFQIQNAAGTSNLFVADTANSRIGIGTNTPTATLAVNGTGLIQASSASNPTVTVSGNEITDASRTTNTSGDGRTPPDSSYGIWESTTNLVVNGGFESNTNAWTLADPNLSATMTRSTASTKFGTTSLKLTNTTSEDGNAGSTNITVSPSTTYTVSAWVNASGFIAPASANRILQVVNQTPVSLGQINLTSATNGWVRETLTFTTGASDTAINVRLYAPVGTVYWDGVQLEQKAMATPYVETNGTTATRNAAEVQPPLGSMNTTQGWMAMRVRVGFPSTVTPSSPTMFGSLSIDGNNRLQIVWNGGQWQTRRWAGGVQGSNTVINDTFNAGDMRTLIIKWDASTISLSVNGSVFGSATVSNSNTFTPTKFDIGSQGGGSNADSDFLWFASGTGTLSDSEAANINGFGNTDPGYSSFAGPDATTFVWQANNASYINSSSNSPLAFNVTNSSGSSLFNVDANLGTVNLQGATSAASSLIFGNDTAANLYRSTTGTIATSGSFAAAGNLTVNGNTKLQTSVNSTTAFQIQNASSANLMVADTVNSRIGIGAAPSAASAAATFQVSGTASVQTASASSVTASGNEITDSRRAEGATTTNVVGHSYDGRTNDSSYGIWEGTTNLVSNGGLETNATGWTTSGSNTVARDTTKAKFGSASLKATYQNNIQIAAFNNITVTSGQTYTASAWVYVPLSYDGTQPQLEIDGGTAVIPLGVRNQWQRVTVTFTATSASDNLALIERGTVPTAGQSIYLDGVQVENKSIATPYVETNGSTQTRTGGRIQAPASNINVTQGWFAFRIRMGFASTQTSALTTAAGESLRVAQWQDNVSNRIVLVINNGNQFVLTRTSGASGTNTGSPSQTFSAGDIFTVVAKWDSGNIYVSVNGGSFSSNTNTNIPTLAATTFDIGSDAGSVGWIDSDILWTATGTGTLNNSDAATINNFGNADPNLTSFSSQDSSSTPTFVWKANSSNYQNQLAFSVQNSSGANELGVDVADGSVLFSNATTSASALILGNDANLYRSASQTLKTDGNLTVGNNLTVNGSALLQNATDSTTAFQINQANGTNLLTVDTLNGRVGIGTSAPGGLLTLQKTGVADLGINTASSNGNSNLYLTEGSNYDSTGALLQYNGAGNSFNILTTNGNDWTAKERLTILRDSGYVGIGTTNPTTLLDVAGNALFQNATDSATGFQIQNQAGNSNLFVADTLNSKVGINEAPSSTGAALQVGGNVDITGNYRINGAQIATSNLSDASNIALLNGTGPQTFTGNNKFTGIATFQNASDSTSAVQIQNSAGTSNLFLADTTNTRIAIAQASAAYTLDVGGDINTTGIIRINGAQVSTSSLSDGSNIGLLNANNTFSGNNTFTGTVLAKTTSTTAFQIQNAGGTQLLVADTSNMRLYVGNPSGDTTTGTLLVLDNISNSGDPAGINGAMYYNSTSGKFRCYEASVWTNCIDSSQLAATSTTQTVSSTSYGDVTGLGFSVLATKNYMLQCSLLISVTGNGGNISMNGPASPTNYTATFQKTSDQSAGDTFTTSGTYDDGNSSTTFRVQTSTTGTNKFILTYNAVLNNGSNAGTWQIRAKAADGTSTLVFYPTSTCTLRPF